MFGFQSLYCAHLRANFFNSQTSSNPTSSDPTKGLGGQTLAALAAGFICVSIGFGLFGGNLNQVLAEDDGGARAFLNSEAGKRAPIYRAPAYRTLAEHPAPSYGQFAAAPPLRLAAKDPAKAKRIAVSANDVNGLGKTTLARAGIVSIDASTLPQRSYCVRLCDGYYFPIAPTSGGGDLEGHQALCSGLCPGAPTKLFVLRSGSEKIEEAVARDGKRYSQLPVAFRHTTTSDNTCACRRNNEAHSSLVSLLKDFTLRQGDGVMTQKGLRFFKGSRNYPFVRDDFQTLAQAKVTGKDRAALGALERSSMVASRTTETAPAVPVAKAAPNRAVQPVAGAAKEKPATFSPVAAQAGFDAPAKPVRLVGPQAMLAQ